MNTQARRLFKAVLHATLVAGVMLGQVVAPPSAAAQSRQPGVLADAFEEQVAVCVLVLAQDPKYEYDFKAFLQACEQIVKETHPELWAAHIGSSLEAAEAAKLQAIAPTCGLIMGVGYGALEAAVAQAQAAVDAANAALRAVPTGDFNAYMAASGNAQSAYSRAKNLKENRDARVAIIGGAIAGSLPPGVTLQDVQSACAAAFFEVDQAGLALVAYLTIDTSVDDSTGRLFNPSCPPKSSHQLNSVEDDTLAVEWRLWASASPRDAHSGSYLIGDSTDGAPILWASASSPNAQHGSYLEIGTLGGELLASVSPPDPITATLNDIGVFWDGVVASVNEWCPCGNPGNSDKKKKSGDDDDDEDDDEKEKKEREEAQKKREAEERKKEQDELKAKQDQLIASSSGTTTTPGC